MKKMYLYYIGCDISFETKPTYRLVATKKRLSISKVTKLAKKKFPEETIISVTRHHVTKLF